MLTFFGFRLDCTLDRRQARLVLGVVRIQLQTLFISIMSTNKVS
jgi:hypothetical protein